MDEDVYCLYAESLRMPSDFEILTIFICLEDIFACPKAGVKGKLFRVFL
jgi:hypothetical protein